MFLSVTSIQFLSLFVCALSYYYFAFKRAKESNLLRLYMPQRKENDNYIKTTTTKFFWP